MLVFCVYYKKLYNEVNLKYKLYFVIMEKQLLHEVTTMLSPVHGCRRWLCQDISKEIKDILMPVWVVSLLNQWQHWTVLVEKNNEKIQVDAAPLDWTEQVYITDITEKYIDFGNMPLIDGKPYLKIT